MSKPPTTILIGLSGPSSSGKTTLARLLRSICNIQPSTSPPNNSTTTTNNEKDTPSIQLFILHEDDFYKTDADIPNLTTTSPAYGTRTLQDWDCAESLDIPLLRSTLSHVKQHGTLPADTVSKEDQNSVGESGVSDEMVAGLTREFAEWFASQRFTNTIRICIIDGFLLYPEPPTGGEMGGSDIARLYEATARLFDLKLFLRSGREMTVRRRAARSGYVTLEGFWADPPGYVEDVVWPNYARDHAWMFEGGDVEGEVKGGVVEREEIRIGPGKGEKKMGEILNWALERVKEVVSLNIRMQE